MIEFSEAELKRMCRRALMADIQNLERAQPRALRELALGLPGGLERLQTIDDQIAALRAQLRP